MLDLTSARQAGYSDSEILNFLKSKYTNFDFDKAKEAGWTVPTIVEHLTSFQTNLKIFPERFKGDSGNAGIMGAKGDTGLSGKDGRNGIDGLQGPIGPQGIQGPVGEQGLQGITGAKGDKGDAGDRGEKGDTGPKGLRGDKGEQGPPGPIKDRFILGGSGYRNKIMSQGTGTSLIRNENKHSTGLKSLAAGSNITITDSGTGTLTISSTATGNFVGPNSATDNAIVRFDGTTGKLGQNSLLQITDLGQLLSPVGGAYRSNAVMLSQPSGIVTTGTLPFNEPNYISGSGDYSLVFGDPASGAMQATTGVQYLYPLNNYWLTLGILQDGFPGTGGIYQYGQSGADFFTGVDSGSASVSYRLTEFSYIKSNDTYGTRSGNVFGTNRTGSIGSDATINIYQEGDGSYWSQGLDKSDNIKWTWNDATLDLQNVALNTANIITCLHIDTGGSTSTFNGTILSNSAIQLTDGTGIIAGTSTGSKIGFGPTEKWGKWGSTPIIQPTNTATIDQGVLVASGYQASGATKANFTNPIFAPSTPIILSTTTGINGKTVANTNLYTVPAGKTAIVIGYIVRCTAATAITVGASAGIGNSSGTNNIAASQAMTALLTTADTFNWPIVGMSKTITTGNSAFFNLGTAATGTSQTLAVDLLGYLI